MSTLKGTDWWSQMYSEIERLRSDNESLRLENESLKAISETPNSSESTLTETSRGFQILKFRDAYDHKCSLQVSSACDPHVWLGVDDAEPKIMASKADAFGVQTTETTGWVPYPIHDEVLLNTRMHLSRGNVAMLIRELVKWFKTEEL